MCVLQKDWGQHVCGMCAMKAVLSAQFLADKRERKGERKKRNRVSDTESEFS